MSKSRSRSPSQRVDMKGAYYYAIPFCLADSEAYLSSSLRAKAILGAILRSFTGFNNGAIAVSMNLIALRIGSANHAANRAAVGEMIGRGILKARVFPPGSRKATEYECTFIESGPERNRIPASNEYLDWQPGDAGGFIRRAPPAKRRAKQEKSRVATIETRNGLRVATIATEEKRRVATIATEKRGVDGNPRELDDVRVAIAARHIRLPCTEGAEPPRPISVSDERWRAAAKRAAEDPAGPDPDDLRRRCLDHIERHGPGSQGRLAAQSTVPTSTLSKFLSGKTAMDNRRRVLLACAIPRAAALEIDKPAATIAARPDSVRTSPPAFGPAAASDHIIDDADAPLSEEVRARLRAFKREKPVGSMSWLATTCGVSLSVVSRFLNEGRIAPAALTRIAAALPAMNAAEREAAPAAGRRIEHDRAAYV